MGLLNYIFGGSDQYVQRTYDNFNEVQRTNNLIFGKTSENNKTQVSSDNKTSNELYGVTKIPNDGNVIKINEETSVSADYASSHSLNTIYSGVYIPDNGKTFVVGDDGKSSTITEIQNGEIYAIKTNNPEIHQTNQEFVSNNQTLNLNNSNNSNNSNNNASKTSKKSWMTNEQYKKVFGHDIINPYTSESVSNTLIDIANTKTKYVSLNICCVNKNDNVSAVNKSRIDYILGKSGILRELFGNTNGLVFPYTPTISEDVSVAYNSVDLPHTNLTPKAHSNTSPPNITIKSSWTCEDEDNAKRMYGALLFVKSLSLANFGKMSKEEDKGLPPPILYLNGWGDLYTNVPVVITNYSYSLPDNIHYVNIKINNNVNVWLPMILDLSITLGIQPNIDTYRNEFNLEQFKKDMMLGSTKSGQGFGYTW